jgi:exopolysaccharide biosynthesis polyprenyl glycosylphosphotransferase
MLVADSFTSRIAPLASKQRPAVTANPLMTAPAPRSVRRASFPSRRKVRAHHVSVSLATFSFIADVLAGGCAFLIAFVVRYGLEVGGPIAAVDQQSIGTFLPPMAVTIVLVVVVFLMRGMYRQPRNAGLLDMIPRIVGAFTTVMAGVVLLAFFFRFAPSRLMFLYAWVAGILLMVAHRIVSQAVQRRLWQRGIGVDRVLVIGDGESGRRIMQALGGSPGLGYQLVGFAGTPGAVDRMNVATERGIMAFPRLGTPDQIPELVETFDVDEVIVLPSGTGTLSVLDVVQHCRQNVVRFRIVPDLLQFSLDRVDLAEIGGVPTIGVRDASIRGWNAAMKRSIDIAVSLMVLAVAALPMAVIALLVRWDTPGPVLFRQTRIGQHEVPFRMVKFRCMVDRADELWAELVKATTGADDRLFKLRNDPRMTRSGRWLRRFSLDELPQFVQVLRGEMSLIGPRPPLPLEVAGYEQWHRQRLLVKPGMTGLWQVNGRSSLTFDEMVRLDLYYAENWTAWLDIKILLRTVPAVLLGRGAF